MTDGGPLIERVHAGAYRVPTDPPESDGTLEWSFTGVLVVEVNGGGKSGLGYSYTSTAAVELVREALVAEVEGQSALSPEAATARMVRRVRNVGLAGVAATAISAVDVALWDLKARLLGLPLVDLLGAAREEVAVYGSGGFTSLSLAELAAQLGGWADEGMHRVKMKVGRDPVADMERVAAARGAIGQGVELFVDANGAYGRKRALHMAAGFAAYGVTWLEEPVSSDDLEGLRLVRERAPASIAISAGEYGYDPWYFRRMLESQAVDVLQADATRCLGVTGFLRASALAEAFFVPLSSHCAPALHLPLCAAAEPAVHMEWFHDHALIESRFFDGCPRPAGGTAAVDRARPGLGLELRRADVERYAV